MKKVKISILLLLSIISLQVYAPVNKKIIYIEISECIKPFEDLWEAVCMVESTNNPLAVNQEEQAYGIAQIRQCRIDHFNQLTKKNYTLQDCFNPDIAKEVFLQFAKLDLEKTAKSWNGSGPMTEIYWEKVKKYL
jgi:hypothetical protein